MIGTVGKNQCKYSQCMMTITDGDGDIGDYAYTESATDLRYEPHPGLNSPAPLWCSTRYSVRIKVATW